MKVAIFESIVTPGGHEHDFDNMLVTEYVKAGYSVVLIVPEGYPFKIDYGVPVHYLKGRAISYAGVSGFKKMILALTREIRRIKWFNQIADYASTDNIEAIIIPTATYRFLRSVRHSKLVNSPVPVIPVMHGINPKEAPKFFGEIEKLKRNPAIMNTVITLGTNLFGRSFDNVRCVLPPFYPPTPDINTTATNDKLTLGFFGQYRREKNLDAFLDTFLKCRFTIPVKLLVQGATSLPEDATDFQRIQEKYRHAEQINFWHKALIGRDWHEAIAGVDVLIMPYSAERYLYHWSAMLFTAIGFQKPVVMADTINPEVLTDYNIGMTFNTQDNQALQQVLEQFVNTYPAMKSVYYGELRKARHAYAPTRFVRDLLTLNAMD